MSNRHPVERHTPVTAEEIAQVFDEVEAPADLSVCSIEDWATRAVFWLMAICAFLQFFTRPWGWCCSYRRGWRSCRWSERPWRSCPGWRRCSIAPLIIAFVPAVTLWLPTQLGSIRP